VTGGGKVGKGRERKGKWDLGPAGRRVPGAPHWQKIGLIPGNLRLAESKPRI